jgi:hypothetical protein
MKSFSPSLPPLCNPKSHHHDSKPTRIQYSNQQCSPYPKCFVHPNHVIILSPLTLPLMYFGLCPQNPCEMTK